MTDQTLSLTPPAAMPIVQRIGLSILGLGIVGIIISLLADSACLSTIAQQLWLYGSLSATAIGGVIYFREQYGKGPAGIRNNGIFQHTTTRPFGWLSWVLALLFTSFYILLYWWPQYLHGLIAFTDPLFTQWFGRSGLPVDGSGNYNPWLAYGLLYTLATVIMGVRFMYKYRHVRYQLWRTISVVFFQLIFAFLLPNLLAALNGQELYFHYFWPLDFDVLFPSSISRLTGGSAIAHFFFWWSLFLALPGTVLLTYFFGKRWYCSWVCGCGALAETAGDPYRHLANTSKRAWQWEVYIIYSVLAAITIITGLLLIDQVWPFIPTGISNGLQRWYGFIIGSVFAGVIGVGFYPLLGARVWCRFGCPQAAILGLLQKYFSRFRITTNGGQCISCGQCSTYCEMGIDVKWYAQREQNIVRASCVGCGICSAVCPRGVLNLESGPFKHKTAIHIDRDEVKLLEP